MSLSVDLTGPPRLWEEPELGVWRRAAVTALAEIDPSISAPPPGDPMLREHLAELLTTAPDRVTVTSGVRATAGVLMRGCAEVVVERPTFLGVVHALRREGLPVRTDPWERLAIPRTAGDGLWFTAPCRNPDGRRLDDRLLAAIAAAADRGHRVVCNTAYRWFAPMPLLPPTVHQVGTLHKLAGPGARLGWTVTEPLGAPLAQALASTAPPLHWQRTWGYFLAAGGAGLLLRRHCDIEAARTALFAALGDPGRAASHDGPNVLLPVGMPESVAVARLAQVGVRVSPGSAFGALRPSIRVCLTWITPGVAAEVGGRIAAALGIPGAGRLTRRAAAGGRAKPS